jgi:hypothetical protein
VPLAAAARLEPVPVARDGPRPYRRREPERTLLHRVMRERLEPFLQAARDRSVHGRGLPAFVERELRAYLDCGILARGFARVRCPYCGFERLVTFSRRAGAGAVVPLHRAAAVRARPADAG